MLFYVYDIIVIFCCAGWRPGSETHKNYLIFSARNGYRQTETRHRRAVPNTKYNSPFY